VVLADVSDNPGSGGSTDATTLLKELIAADAQDVAMAVMYDPEVVLQAEKAGTGSTIHVALGGKLVPEITGGPVECDAYVKALETMFDKLNKLDIPCVYLTEHMMNTYSAEGTPEIHKEYSVHTAELENTGFMEKLFNSGIAVAKQYNVPVCDMYHKWRNLYSCGADITLLLANRINHPIREMHDVIAHSLISTLFFE